MFVVYCDRESTVASHKASLDAQEKQVAELKETNSSMKADIQRAKSSLVNEPKLQAKVSELESLVSSMEHQNQQLTVSQSVCVGKSFVHKLS